MADKKRLLDIWILEINKVYRDVPFAVVTDWLQQGRLLPEDKVRQLVEDHITGRLLGIIGEPHVNVLRLNLALDAVKA
jgi:hypothetical protein